MNIDGKTVKIIRSERRRQGATEGTITLMIDHASVTMTLGEWSRLISQPD